MKKAYLLAAVILVISVVGGFVWRSRHLSQVQSPPASATPVVSDDPFANIVIPSEYASDDATRREIQLKIDRTKAMYQESPKIWETWIAIGNLRTVLKDYAGAISAYQKSLETQGNNVLGYRNIANVYDQNLQDYIRAVSYYRLAVAIAPDPQIYQQIGLLQSKKLNQPTEAEKTYVEGLKHNANDADLLRSLIRLYQETGDTAKYKATVRQLLQAYPKNAEFQKAYGSALR